MTSLLTSQDTDDRRVPRPRSRAWFGVAGLTATAAGLGAAELVGGMWGERAPSPVVAVAAVFVDRTPGAAVRTGIEVAGRADKPLLLIAVTVATLALGFTAARWSRDRVGRFAAAVAALAALGLWAQWRQPTANGAASALTSGVGLAVSLGVGTWMLRRAASLERATVRAAPSAGPGAPNGGTPEQSPGAPFDVPSPPVASPIDPPASRRQFLTFAGAGASFAAFGAVAGNRIRSGTGVDRARAELELPVATRTSQVAAGTLDDVAGVTPYLPPSSEFYRIDTALLVPQVDPATWSLTIGGMVDTKLRFTLDDLLARDLVEVPVTLSCVSNEVGGDLVGNATWRGIALSELLDEAGLDPAATQIASRSVDGWTCGFPVEAAYDGRNAVVAVAMNGEPLPLEHGFPARLVVAGLYGYVSATKWLEEIRLTTFEDFTGYWIPRGWSRFGPVKTQSRIDVPRRGQTPAAGKVAVAGIAWAPTRGIAKVEVQIDDQPWTEARRGTPVSDETWVQWVHEWDATPGEHRLRVRATDGTGETQTEQRTSVAPDGATGWHTVEVTVA